MAYFSLDWVGDIFEDLYITHKVDAFVYTKKTTYSLLGLTTFDIRSPLSETAYNGRHHHTKPVQ